MRRLAAFKMRVWSISPCMSVARAPSQHGVFRFAGPFATVRSTCTVYYSFCSYLLATRLFSFHRDGKKSVNLLNSYSCWTRSVAYRPPGSQFCAIYYLQGDASNSALLRREIAWPRLSPPGRLDEKATLNTPSPCQVLFLFVWAPVWSKSTAVGKKDRTEATDLVSPSIPTSRAGWPGSWSRTISHPPPSSLMPVASSLFLSASQSLPAFKTFLSPSYPLPSATCRVSGTL